MRIIIEIDESRGSGAAATAAPAAAYGMASGLAIKTEPTAGVQAAAPTSPLDATNAGPAPTRPTISGVGPDHRALPPAEQPDVLSAGGAPSFE